MKEIWKYELHPGSNSIEMPVGSEILEIREQHHNVCVWVMVDPSNTQKVYRRFVVFGTGQAIHEEELKYLGTASLDSGNLIFHVFEADL